MSDLSHVQMNDGVNAPSAQRPELDDDHSTNEELNASAATNQKGGVDLRSARPASLAAA